VLGTRELRDRIPSILREFREEGAEAEAIVGGANRRPEIVMLSYERYLQMMDALDNLSIEATYRERMEGRAGGRGRTLEDAARELGFDPDEVFAEPPDADRKDPLS
jgi:PHD/YefM family antitoxin component YafN of YafNO toxin-antitoxin module